MAIWTIRAQYDDEAHVWYSVEGEIPGLAADAETLEQLVAKAGAMLPDLLEIHRDEFVDAAAARGAAQHPDRGVPRAGISGCSLTMVQGFTPRVRVLLRDHGCTRIRSGKGDHEVWLCPTAAKPVVVDGKIMSRHSANQVLKDAGIKFKF